MMNGESVILMETPRMKYLTSGQAAERLQVSRYTVIRWIRQGRFGEVAQGGFGKTSPNKIPEPAVEAVARTLGILPPGENGNEEG